MRTDFKNAPISSDLDMFQKFFNTSETLKIYFKERQLHHSVCIFWIEIFKAVPDDRDIN